MGMKSDEIQWVCKTPAEPTEIKFLTSADALSSHPLTPIISMPKMETSSVRKLSNDKSPLFSGDPLTSGFVGADPLSVMAAQQDWDDIDQTSVRKRTVDKCDNPWIEQRAAILSKFTTTQKLSIASGLLPGAEKAPLKHQISPPLRNKLEQLDDFEELTSREMEYLSQQEFVDTINQLSKDLTEAWQNDFRVKALKIAIQCSKLLVDTSVIPFYPSKFVLITDVLDVFGSLVYERLLSKAEYQPGGWGGAYFSADNFSPEMVPESAKETCRNWFYKIASIRELVPRLYVEAAVLKSYNFLTTSELSQALRRLTKMTRGIGDPLVAVYTRCYLCRIGQNLLKGENTLLKDNFYDFLDVYEPLFSNSIQHQVASQKIDMATYLGTFVPALDWILKGLSEKCSDYILIDVTKKCMEKKSKGLLLNSILSTYKQEFVAFHAEMFVRQIGTCVGDAFPFHLLLKGFGECLKNHIVSSPSLIIKQYCKLISHVTNHADYLICVQAWISFIVKYTTVEELNTILGSIIQRIGAVAKPFYMILHDIIIIIVTDITDVDLLFAMDKFLPLIDLLSNEGIRASTCHKILDIYCNTHLSHYTTDPVVTDALLFIAKVLHDSVNELTVEDEKRQYGLLISQLIRKIDFGDFDKQLSFYVEARGTFMNLDSVIVTLIHCVNRVGMERGRRVKGHHTRKTASFVRACAAYSYITIPSICSEVTRLRLYLATAQVALSGQCLGQADACIASSLSLLPELPFSVEIDGKIKSNEAFLLEYVRNLLSTLIVVPDSPEEGILYLTRGLVNMLVEYVKGNSLTTVTRLFIDVIDMLSVSALPEYPYHVRNVDSNNVLYGSDPKFLSEINKMCSILLQEILSNLQILGEKKELTLQAELAFELFLRVVLRADLESPGTAKLAYRLWALALKNGKLDKKLTVRTLDALKRKIPQYPANSGYSLLVSKLNVNS